MGAAKLAVITAFGLLTGILSFYNGVCVNSCCDSILLFPILIVIQHVLRGRKINGTAHFNYLYPNDAKNMRKLGKCTSTDDFEYFLFNAKTAELKNVATSMDENFSPTVNNPFLTDLDEPNIATIFREKDNLKFETLKEGNKSNKFLSKRETPTLQKFNVGSYFCDRVSYVYSPNWRTK
ncbi:hypothetical protein CEXT_530511 [Caerostris extrusa]|uniref:Uncharacterized protein n=1 Tax=Caerostris extrusa TaxID=172846 RepID=A0AAV4TA30_CAEEX|nr:hypothetical protein CEXT_530511 [Caerostris extrusa]